MRHYTLVCTNRDDPDGFARVNRLMADVFGDFLPDWCSPAASEGVDAGIISSGTGTTQVKSLGFSEIERLLKRSLQSLEFEQGLVSWLDSPENIDKIIFSVGSEDQPDGHVARRGWDEKHWPELVQKVLDRAVAGIRKTGAVQRNKRIFSFIRHFMRLRHDLKLAYQAHKVMADIRLLTKPEDIELSRGNGTLNEFVLREELQSEKRKIRNHVILKADWRGSTAITSQLREKT